MRRYYYDSAAFHDKCHREAQARRQHLAPVTPIPQQTEPKVPLVDPAQPKEKRPLAA
jgi:hypothetical protein